MSWSALCPAVLLSSTKALRSSEAYWQMIQVLACCPLFLIRVQINALSLRYHPAGEAMVDANVFLIVVLCRRVSDVEAVGPQLMISDTAAAVNAEVQQVCSFPR